MTLLMSLQGHMNVYFALDFTLSASDMFHSSLG